MKDPHYKPALQNPFATLPRLREGKKIIGSSGDLFSSCFELPSPARVSTPTTFFEDLSTPTKSTSLYDLKVKRSKFEDHLFFGRVEYLKRLYSGNASWTTQDDSVLSSFSSCSSSSVRIKELSVIFKSVRYFLAPPVCFLHFPCPALCVARACCACASFGGASHARV